MGGVASPSFLGGHRRLNGTIIESHYEFHFRSIMFLDELQPVFKELLQQPMAFTGGLVSGLLRLKLSEDPLKSWLQQQGLTHFTYNDPDSGNGSGPQSISID